MRRLQQEMQQEREKYNQLLLKFQDLQSQVIEDSHVSFQWIIHLPKKHFIY